MIRLIAQCLLGIGVWLCLLNVSAQDTSIPSAGNKGETVIRQAPLDVIYLEDDKGTRHLMPRWTIPDLEALYNFISKNQQTPVPSFVLRNISATGTVIGNYVEVEIDVQVEFLTTSSQPIRIPLGFAEGILPSEDQSKKQTFRYTGAGSASLIVDPLEGQYVALVVPRAEPVTESEEPDKSEKPDIDQRHRLSLLLWFPLVQNGRENQLTLSFPQSNSSQFQFEVPMSNIDVSVTRGILHDQQENIERQSTVLGIQGLRSNVEISWRKKKVEFVDARPMLIVEQALIDVRLHAQSVDYDVTLPVSSATGGFDQLQIRLPQGCVLDREFTNRYAVDNDYSVSEVDNESIVTIQFQRKTSGPVPLRLKGIQRFEGDATDYKRELTGFEVLGAERQSGILTTSVLPPDMTSRWEPVRGILRTDRDGQSIPTPTIPASTASTRFEFITQPFLLRVQVAPPQTRISVKPDYQFHVRKGGVTMTARLSYVVRGSKANFLKIQLSDSQWECTFDTSSLVDVAGVDVDDSGLMTIPLRSPMEAFEIELRARKPIATDDGEVHRFVLPMPKPIVDWSEPAPVAIVFDKDIEVLPIEESYLTSSEQHHTGLTRQTRPAMASMRVEVTDLQQEPFYYRAEPTNAVYVADLIYRQQKITATMQTNVRLFGDDNQVTQTISYESAYAPVERLYFLIPKSTESSSDIQIQSDEPALELRGTISEIQNNVPENWVRKFVQFSNPKFRFQLEFQYSLPLTFSTASTDDTTRQSLSFICPEEVPVSDHRIHFFTPPGYRVELQNDSRLLWEPFREPRRPSSQAVETFRSVQSPTRIVLHIHAPEKSALGTSTVERAWIQTWLTDSLRVDRAMYLLRSANDSVVLQLPKEANRVHSVVVRINGQQVDDPNIHDGLLTISDLSKQRNHPIEIFVEYRFAFSMSGIEVPLILPSFTKETLIQHQFWQVILPQSKHIVGCPKGWTLEYDWQWNGLFWWREPSIHKQDIGFESDPNVTEHTISGGQYVFSHFQPPPYVTLYIVNRSLIILCSSGIALFIGLILIYVPQSRYVGSLFGLGIALLAALFYQPPLVLLMLQAAVFGVFLALGAGYLYRIFHRQKQWIPPAFSMADDMSFPYFTPIPPQTVHEVMMDEESAGEDVSEPSVAHNGQS